MNYKRILLKLSGESLMGDQNYGISSNRLSNYAQEIKDVIHKGVQIAVVIGGGNIYRGIQSEGAGFDRVQGDYMGMLATVINSLALQDSSKEHPALISGSNTSFCGLNIFATSAMNLTPQKTIVSALVLCAFFDRSSESPIKAAIS